MSRDQVPRALLEGLGWIGGLYMRNPICKFSSSTTTGGAAVLTLELLFITGSIAILGPLWAITLAALLRR